MLKVLRIITIVIIMLLILAALLLAGFRGMAGLLVIALGYLLLYYVIVLGAVIGLNTYHNRKPWHEQVVLALFAAPLAYMLFDAEGLFEFLMSGVHLDMK